MWILLAILSLVNIIFAMIRNNKNKIIHSFYSMTSVLMSLVICYCDDTKRLVNGDVAGALDLMPTLAKGWLGFSILIILLNAFVVYRFWREDR